MSLIVELELRSIVTDFDLLMLRCNRLGLTEVTKRIEPIRDVIQKGIELRKLVREEKARSEGVVP